MRYVLPALLLVHIVATSVFAGSSAKLINAARTDTPPVLDGNLSDVQWNLVAPITDFTQYDPAEGATPTESTSVRVLYDDNALYVGVMCYDSNPLGIVRQLTRRDRSSEADRLTVQIDSYSDNQTAFVFAANVSGVQSDGILSQDGLVYDLTWDAVWDAQTQINESGWSVEFSIPYNALRFVEKKGVYTWGVNFRRYISRKRETIEWVMIPRTESMFISRWGNITGISDIRFPLHLEILPYVSGRATFQSAAATRPATSDADAAAGLDIKYGVSRNFILNATINPDFGQVEVDQSVLNLTVFETQFPEKRPFFLEGAQLFTFGSAVDNTSLPLFFSRRIGKQPSMSGSVSAPPGGTIEENPRTTTILGAAKFTGRTEGGISLGIIAAATDEEQAQLRDSTGKEFPLRTEPRGLYSVIRFKNEGAHNSYFGAMATIVAKEQSLNTISGGIDWSLRTGRGLHTFDGYLATSHTPGFHGHSAGLAGRMLFSRLSSDHWFYTTAYEFFTDDFDINETGFFAQAREHGGYSQVIYRENFAATPLRRYSLALNPEYRWNMAGRLTQLLLNTVAAMEFSNFWSGTLTHIWSLPSYIGGERGVIGVYRKYSSQDLQLSVQSDERQWVSGSLAVGTGWDTRLKRSFYVLVNLKVRPSPWLELTPYGLYADTDDEETGVLSGGGIATLNHNSLFAYRDVDQVDVGLRGIVTFTRSLSLQFFTQVLIARGKHEDYRILLGERSLQPVSPGVNYDFNFVNFNANMLLRWEYLPGSTLYFVWTQGRFDYLTDYSRGFGSRLTDTFKLPHEDVLLLKASYWLPL